ncbi:hypothetical protein HMPREF1321_0509 [Capnocytophaga sp. oral taxon 412 str. F0487]|nr:hypothetical protein HMPREF1321_0509 [Capnocytophaga sp. oral taxon 412 str. F0487]
MFKCNSKSIPSNVTSTILHIYSLLFVLSLPYPFPVFKTLIYDFKI